jgi:hypothetical protein
MWDYNSASIRPNDSFNDACHAINRQARITWQIRPVCPIIEELNQVQQEKDWHDA